MTGRLQDKAAVVTGAGSGIGKAITERFVAEGAKVVAVDISGNQNAVAERLGRIASRFTPTSPSRPMFKPCLRPLLPIWRPAHTVQQRRHRSHMAPVGEYPEDEWEKVMAINLRSVFLGMRYGIPLMLKSGGGSIVNTASMAAMVLFRTWLPIAPPRVA